MSRFGLVVEYGWRSLKEDDGRITLATQTVLLFFLLTLSLTSASIQRYLSDNLDQMLGSDLVIESHTRMAGADEITLLSLANRVSVTQLSDVTLTFRDTWAKATLKLVDDAYPLQGSLQIGETPASPQRAVDSGPRG